MTDCHPPIELQKIAPYPTLIFGHSLLPLPLWMLYLSLYLVAILIYRDSRQWTG
jgi:hypothetical protein